MEHSFEVRVTQADAEKALRRFLWGMVGNPGLLAVAVLMLTVGVGLDAQDGALRPGSIVSLTLTALLPLIYCTGYWGRWKQIRQLLTRLGDSPVLYQLSDTEIRTETILGVSSLKWEVVKELWITADLTMVFYARNAYTTIPTPQAPSAALQFLVAKVSESGGKIRDKRAKA